MDHAHTHGEKDEGTHRHVDSIGFLLKCTPENSHHYGSTTPGEKGGCLHKKSNGGGWGCYLSGWVEWSGELSLMALLLLFFRSRFLFFLVPCGACLHVTVGGWVGGWQRHVHTCMVPQGVCLLFSPSLSLPPSLSL